MVEKCYICGTESGNAYLFDAIYEGSIVKICETCAKKEGVPLIKSGGDVGQKDSDKNKSTYERLSNMAGIDPQQHRQKFGNQTEETEKKDYKDQNLRKIVEEKSDLAFPKLNQVKAEKKDDLVRNFHWTIFQARRAKKMSQKDLAQHISEPERAIRLVERGVLPDNYKEFIKKIQFSLGVTLFAKPEKKKGQIQKKNAPKESTLEDLRERKSDIDEEEEEEPEEKVPFWKKILNKLKPKNKRIPVEEPDEENIEPKEKILGIENHAEKSEKSEKATEKNNSDSSEAQNKEEKGTKEELADEDIDSIIYGKK